jgi:hypothetical protein
MDAYLPKLNTFAHDNSEQAQSKRPQRYGDKDDVTHIMPLVSLRVPQLAQRSIKAPDEFKTASIKNS